MLPLSDYIPTAENPLTELRWITIHSLLFDAKRHRRDFEYELFEINIFMPVGDISQHIKKRYRDFMSIWHPDVRERKLKTLNMTLTPQKTAIIDELIHVVQNAYEAIKNIESDGIDWHKVPSNSINILTQALTDVLRKSLDDLIAQNHCTGTTAEILSPLFNKFFELNLLFMQDDFSNGPLSSFKTKIDLLRSKLNNYIDKKLPNLTSKGKSHLNIMIDACILEKIAPHENEHNPYCWPGPFLHPKNINEGYFTYNEEGKINFVFCESVQPWDETKLPTLKQLTLNELLANPQKIIFSIVYTENAYLEELKKSPLYVDLVLPRIIKQFAHDTKYMISLVEENHFNVDYPPNHKAVKALQTLLAEKVTEPTFYEALGKSNSVLARKSKHTPTTFKPKTKSNSNDDDDDDYTPTIKRKRK